MKPTIIKPYKDLKLSLMPLGILKKVSNLNVSLC